jgi:hypothetical protein
MRQPFASQTSPTQPISVQFAETGKGCARTGRGNVTRNELVKRKRVLAGQNFVLPRLNLLLAPRRY